jgi:predicted ATPase/DNA-binding winged helix-turn-helix (wHTH) protein
MAGGKAGDALRTYSKTRALDVMARRHLRSVAIMKSDYSALLTPDDDAGRIWIGRFELDLCRRRLRADGQLVRISARALDILTLLAEAQGALVCKEQIMREVWPDTIVGENTLQVYMSSLRKLLGDDRSSIVTVSRKGYRLIRAPADPEATPDRPEHPERLQGRAGSSNLPARGSELFGRASGVRDVTELLAGGVVVTLMGVGGVGKSRLAVEVARGLSSQFSGGVWYVDLSGYTCPADIPQAIAAAARLAPADGKVTLEELLAGLSGLKALVVLDNSEQVINAVARVAEALARSNGELRILVTSREALRISAEQLFWVAPLELALADISTEEIAKHPSVKMFIARSKAFEPRMATDPASVSKIGQICYELDGIPLAIELAATRSATLGVDGVFSRLRELLDTLSGGYRTALPRHRTLRASFDWSYEPLEPVVQAVFRQLGIFSGRFTLDAACAVVASKSVNSTAVVEAVSGLVEKSLVAIDINGSAIGYRLLQTTRAYALEKLANSGEFHDVALRHLTWLKRRLDDLEARRTGANTGPRELKIPHELIGESQAALNWAFSERGDAASGVALSTVLAPLLLDFLLTEESCLFAQRALCMCAELPTGTVLPEHEERLRATLSAARMKMEPDRRMSTSLAAPVSQTS